MTELYKLIIEYKLLAQPYIYIVTGILLLVYLINYIKKNEFFEGGYRLYSTIKKQRFKKRLMKGLFPLYIRKKKKNILGIKERF
ncbi:hypothetical protein LH92_03490 [Acinetobacter baumannii]|nr:hypothetical protein LH92_03490 [Acinetobacter baumannii]